MKSAAEEREEITQKLSLKEVAAWHHHWLAMTNFHRTEPVEARAAGKATARLCIFLGTTINLSWATNVVLLVPVLKDYLSQPAGSALLPSLSLPCWQPWGPAVFGTAVRLVRGQNNHLSSVESQKVVVCQKCMCLQCWLLLRFLNTRGFSFPLVPRSFMLSWLNKTFQQNNFPERLGKSNIS